MSGEFPEFPNFQEELIVVFLGISWSFGIYIFFFSFFYNLRNSEKKLVRFSPCNSDLHTVYWFFLIFPDFFVPWISDFFIFKIFQDFSGFFPRFFKVFAHFCLYLRIRLLIVAAFLNSCCFIIIRDCENVCRIRVV